MTSVERALLSMRALFAIIVYLMVLTAGLVVFGYYFHAEDIRRQEDQKAALICVANVIDKGNQRTDAINNANTGVHHAQDSMFTAIAGIFDTHRSTAYRVNTLRVASREFLDASAHYRVAQFEHPVPPPVTLACPGVRLALRTSGAPAPSAVIIRTPGPTVTMHSTKTKTAVRDVPGPTQIEVRTQFVPGPTVTVSRHRGR